MFFLLMGQQAYSQGCSIEVETIVVNASPNQENGRITFRVEGHQEVNNQFVILDLNASKDGKGRDIQLKQYTVSSLAKGIYEFVIVDKKRDKCTKEIQIEIKETNGK